MSEFMDYWKGYKQTNPGWSKLEAQDLVLIGWIGRNKEIEEFVARIQDMTSRLHKIEKEMLQLRLALTQQQAKGDLNG